MALRDSGNKLLSHDTYTYSHSPISFFFLFLLRPLIALERETDRLDWRRGLIAGGKRVEVRRARASER